VKSGIYTGTVRHRRRESPQRSFTYRLTMTWLDLSELPWALDGAWPLWSARRPALLRFDRRDYLGPAELPLDEAVRARVDAELGRRPTGPIRMLTRLRTLGACFNPVTFYYCYEPDGETLDAIVAEITNTPWNERRAHVLDARRGLRFRFPKDFHVSPFLPMDFEYDWRFSNPGRRLVVRMDNLRAGRSLFDATLALRRRELTPAGMLRALLRHPIMSLTALAAIYWQALRLMLRRAPFHPHPREAA
jgi:DUF1365 family protein